MQTAKAQTLSFSESRTYLIALIFIAGNIILPQLVHLIPRGGLIWLPIYFFTLIGAYVYGWKVGVLTAVVSPLVNNLLFGMPAEAMVAPIMLKSALLALAAGYASRRFGRVTVAQLVCVVIAYQLAGTLGEWAMTGDFMLACQDVRMAVPGMLLQIFGGYAVIRILTSKI